MTYQEAKSLFTTLPETYMHEGIVFKPLITPELENDFKNYFSDLKSCIISKDEVEKYSTNHNFVIRGFSIEAIKFI